MVKQNMLLLICAFYYLSDLQVVKSVQVTTPNGIVEGTKFVTAEQNKTYHAFMGIPYAKPPVGKLRFESPQPANNWTGVWNATYERDICAQLNILGTAGSEDCLYINVFTTELPTSSNNSLRPVMFWIHGGGFIVGSGNRDGQGPDYLLNQGVAVVTVNYRLGVFGLLSTGDLVAPGNNALKDQILALHWVKNNIAYFGGDPEKVTIFGQSAGSGCVSYLVQSPLTAGLFRGAIMQSGTTLSQWSLSKTPRKFAFEVGRRLLIFTNDSNTLVERLRDVDYGTLETTSATIADQILQYTLLRGFQLTPVQEPDHPGAVFSGRSCELLKDGKVNPVKVLVGNTSREGVWLETGNEGYDDLVKFGNAFNLLRLLLAAFDVNPAQLVPDDMNVDSSNSTAIGRLIHRHYVGRFGLIATSASGFIDYFSDTQFAYPVHQYVKFVSNFVSNTRYYQFSYEGDLGNPSRGNLHGVGHGEDLAYIFRVAASQNASKSDKLTRNRMVKLWTNFAKYGNPTPVADPLLENVTWDVASTSPNLTFLNINGSLELVTNSNSEAIDFWDNIYGTSARPPCYTF